MNKTVTITCRVPEIIEKILRARAEALYRKKGTIMAMLIITGLGDEVPPEHRDMANAVLENEQ